MPDTAKHTWLLSDSPAGREDWRCLCLTEIYFCVTIYFYVEIDKLLVIAKQEGLSGNYRPVERKYSQGRVWWFMRVSPTLRETEAGGWLKPTRLRLQ